MLEKNQGAQYEKKERKVRRRRGQKKRKKVLMVHNSKKKSKRRQGGKLKNKMPTIIPIRNVKTRCDAYDIKDA